VENLFVEFLFLLVVFSHTVWMSRVYCVPLDLVSLSLCASLYHLVRLIHVSNLGCILKILNWNCSVAPLHMLLMVYYCNDSSFVIWNHCRFSGESVKGQYVAWCWGRSVQYGRWSSRSTGEETISGVSQHVRIPTNNRFKILIPCSSKLDSM